MRLKTEEQMRQARADSVKETSVEGYFCKVAKRYGCKRRKNSTFMGYGEEGWPDQVIVWPDGRGTTDWVELKRPKGGRFETSQPRIHAELRACGARVEVLNTRKLVDEFFAARARELKVKPRVAAKQKSARLLCADDL